MRTESSPLDYLSGIGREYAKRLRSVMKGKETAKRVRRITQYGNVVAEIDLIAERILKDVIEESGAPVILISEDEGIGRIGCEEPKYVLVADPLDGTTNFRRSIPFYGFSLALAIPKASPRLSDVIAGLVMDLCHDEVFLAQRTGRADDEQEGKDPDPDKLMVSLYTYGVKIDPRYFELHPHLLIRGLGSLALELCYVAKGRIDAVVEARGIARTVDVAGSIPFLEAAGGVITDLDGEDLDPELDVAPKMSFIAARNRSIARKILDLSGVRRKTIG